MKTRESRGGVTETAAERVLSTISSELLLGRNELAHFES